MLTELFERGIAVKVLDGIAAGEHAARSLVLDFALALAEDRRRDISRKMKNEQDAARRRGKVGGRPRVIDDDRRAVILARREKGQSIRVIARVLDVSGGTLHAVLAEESAKAEAIAYPSGQEPDFWNPTPADSGWRFALGRIRGCSAGSPPLVVIIMNPSHARETESESDRTVNHVVDVSTRKHSGWLMLNLYPERSSTPKPLKPYDTDLSAANCEAIEHVLGLVGATEVVGAWGKIGDSATLKRALPEVLGLLYRMGVKAYTPDPLLKTGNPAHPHPPGRPLSMLGPKAFIS